MTTLAGGSGGVVGLALEEFEEGGHGGGDPFVFVPEDVGLNVEGGAGPVEGFELVEANFARDDHGGEDGEPHADLHALLDGFDA